MEKYRDAIRPSPAPGTLIYNNDPVIDSHYASSLPQWRFTIRQLIIPFIRAETSYLVSLQTMWRTPSLDTYFAFTANLGTHTFYMVVLPVFFWFGYESTGRAMVHILAFGVCISGFLKDLLCLPRPSSPPLQRITMSDHVSLEYGFPSTHATNTVSVAVYLLCAIRLLDNPLSFKNQLFVQVCIALYVFSIVIGRIYCGMHGFLDVLTGSILGALLGISQCFFESTFDSWILHSTILYPLSVAVATLLFIRLHPEPVDDCPCFDDSVAFAAVVLGVETGSWQQKPTMASLISFHVLGELRLGTIRAILRISLGILIIFTWKSFMKPILLRRLPPIFRNIEIWGLASPRKFFIRASQYQKVPKHLDDNDVIPPAGKIPSMISSLGHPRRRAVSVGPQSAADAYETMEMIRRKQQNSELRVDNKIITPKKTNFLPEERTDYHLASTRSSRELLQKRRGDNGAETAILPSQGLAFETVFSQLEKPRVRYDVEVVTKFIVYAGIGWLAAYLIPDIFNAIGIGVRE